MKLITKAPEAMRYLNGLFCIYKPSGLGTLQTQRTILRNLANDLNEMETRPPKDYVQIEGSVASGKPLAIKVSPSFSDHPLVVGSRYQPQDIRCQNLNTMGKYMSGVQLYAVNDACGKYHNLKRNLVQVIEVKGEFGYATDTGFSDGRVVEKATYRFIPKIGLDGVLSAMEATHANAARECSGVDIESQEAYEAACKGIVRPEGKLSLIVNVVCTEFNLPSFTLRMHCFNATDDFFATIIPEVGLTLKSCAVCTQIRQIQYGPFTLDYALLRKHWRVEHILSNISLCKNLLSEATLPTDALNIQSLEKAKIDHILHRFQQQAKEDTMDNYI